MSRLKTACRFAAAAVVLVFASASANAQATRTWVSGVGDDANPCSRTAPCKTYAGAISKTATNGEINCLDPGGFGTLTIAKSISVICAYTEGGVLASAGTTGFIVNVAVAGSIVNLEGQDVECVGTGLAGIRVLNNNVTLNVRRTRISNCRGGGSGIQVATNVGVSDISVSDSWITNNGNSNLTGGILVNPTGTASVIVNVNRTSLDDNSLGIRVDSAGTTGTVRGIVRDSMITGSAFNAVTASSAGTAAHLMVDNVGVSGNQFGVVAAGNANAVLLVGNSSVVGNNNGVFPLAPGQVLSYGDNRVNGNGPGGDGAFTGAVISKK